MLKLLTHLAGVRPLVFLLSLKKWLLMRVRRRGRRTVISRNLQARQYTQWRQQVFKRDNFRCRMPRCKNKHKKRQAIQAHHIRRWADSPSLRYRVSNGITLCRDCHEKIKGLEKLYERLFTTILNRELLFGENEEETE